MKKLLCLFWVVGGLFVAVSGQVSTGQSNTVLLNFGYPELVIDGPPSYNDSNNNNTIDVGESAQIAFWLENKGKYVANNVIIQPGVVEEIEGLLLPRSENLGNIAPGGRRYVKMVVRSGPNLIAGVAQIQFTVMENFDSTAQVSYAVNTADVEQRARLRINSFAFFSDSNKIELEKPFLLRFDLQNLGNAVARKVSFSIDVPKQILIETDLDEIGILSLNPGEIREIEISLLAGINYTEETIPVVVTVKETSSAARDTRTLTARLTAAATEDSLE